MALVWRCLMSLAASVAFIFMALVTSAATDLLWSVESTSWQYSVRRFSTQCSTESECPASRGLSCLKSNTGSRWNISEELLLGVEVLAGGKWLGDWLEARVWVSSSGDLVTGERYPMRFRLGVFWTILPRTRLQFFLDLMLSPSSSEAEKEIRLICGILVGFSATCRRITVGGVFFSLSVDDGVLERLMCSLICELTSFFGVNLLLGEFSRDSRQFLLDVSASEKPESWLLWLCGLPWRSSALVFGDKWLRWWWLRTS